MSDRDFEAPLPAAQVFVAKLNVKVPTTTRGTYVIRQVPPGEVTLVFSKPGYVSQVKTVVVVAGRLTEVDVSLAGDYAEMDEFIVEDVLQVGAGTEESLLELRFESPALVDSISSELLSRAGASDAGSALPLIAGASVRDNKAVVRGLPDRYVSSQLNGLRLPSADENTRSVELDQFPAAVIESIQVSKTFTPDQQGDASGGAVDVVLRGIPEKPFFVTFQSQLGFNSNVRGRSDFLSYDGGGVSFWGKDRGGRDPQLDRIGQNWSGAAGVSTKTAPTDYKWSLASGGRVELENGLRFGGFGNFFYERDSAFYDDGVDDSYWITGPGEGLTPRTIQGVPQPDADPPGAFGQFKTSLFDVTQTTESVQWGGLLTGGVEWGGQSLDVAFFQTHTTEDTATLAVDTRGKAHFFPGYDPFDPRGTGNEQDNLDAAPYLTTETLQYTERQIETLMFRGRHVAPTGDLEIADFWTFGEPELDWTVADSSARLDQPDKRQFGALWIPPSFREGVPPYTEDEITPPRWDPFKPGLNFTLGNSQRIFKRIEENSDQYFVNLKLPFRQWTDTPGYFKFGLFDDDVRRRFDQNTFSNFNDNSGFEGNFDERWSGEFPFGDHPISDGPPFVDVDYRGDQKLEAWYGMIDLPIVPELKLIAGARVESTDIRIVNIPEAEATWVPPGDTAARDLEPGVADVDFDQDDTLPSAALVYTPIPELTFRGAYSETVARQTFKELTPILQQEFLGGPIFVGNPELRMAALKNYDLRADFRPTPGSFYSVSYFYKSIDDPIEYVQRVVSFDFTTPLNFPSGRLEGWEIEARQDLGEVLDPLVGLSVGGNATFIDSEVRLPVSERLQFQLPGIASPRDKRDATNAPAFLYNLFATYDLDITGTQLGAFYSVTGDTLVAGAGQADGNLVPDVYAKQYDSLNLTLTQKLGQYVSVRFQAKNVTNPRIQTEYRTLTGQSVTKTSFTRGIDYSIAFQVAINF